MERELDDLILGYQEEVDFGIMQDDAFHHSSTFQAMKTPDDASYVIIYQWADPLSKTFNDKEEAFYIDGVNDGNREKAQAIFEKVYRGLQDAFKEDPNQVFKVEELVNNILDEKKDSKKV